MHLLSKDNIISSCQEVRLPGEVKCDRAMQISRKSGSFWLGAAKLYQETILHLMYHQIPLAKTQAGICLSSGSVQKGEIPPMSH